MCICTRKAVVVSLYANAMPHGEQAPLALRVQMPQSPCMCMHTGRKTLAYRYYTRAHGPYMYVHVCLETLAYRYYTRAHSTYVSMHIRLETSAYIYHRAVALDA